MQNDLIPDGSDYGHRALQPEDLKPEPIELFEQWLREALNKQVPEANALCLSTVGRDGFPDSRMVLLKGIDQEGFIFYSNYESAKAEQLDAHPHACMVFWWEPLKRQVRIRGDVSKVSAELSNEYFASRSRESQLGAWASRQSRELSGRSVLEKQLVELDDKFKENIPRPEFWGGYKLVPKSVEFWQGRTSRLHDRFLYRKIKNEWSIQRLMP